MKRILTKIHPLIQRKYCRHFSDEPPKILQQVPDVSYLLNPMNKSSIIENLVSRLCVKTKDEATNMLEDLHRLKELTVAEPSKENRSKLNQAALEFPNVSHPSILDLKEPKTLFDNTKELDLNLPKIRSFDQISRTLFGSRTENTGEATTEKSYYLLGPLAELEQALIHFTVDNLVKMGFKMVSVPDLLHPEIIEACGLKTTGKITNVFKLDEKLHGLKALSGTAEMGFGALLANQAINFDETNVKKFAAVSRCYRAESTMGRKERGLYRVHHFTKVEMFAVTISDPNVSNLVHEQFLGIQQKLFDDLNLFYRVLDMHPGDLGAPATRKFDCEAILPGYLDEPFYGEISSTSNCLDFQSRRLNIRSENSGRFCHTVNGTACAGPRTIMAICEQNQLSNGCVNIPSKLERYLPSLKNSPNPFLGPRPKKQRPVFVYKTSPKAFIQKKN